MEQRRHRHRERSRNADRGESGDHQRAPRQTADKFTIGVSGTDAPSGGPVAASIGTGTAINALLAAPHGTLALGTNVSLTGALAGFDVTVGSNASLVFQSGFPAAVVPAGQQAVTSYVPPPASPVVGPLPGNTVISLALALPLRNLSTLQSIIDQASDPMSANYKHYVNHTDFMNNYGPLAADYGSISTWAASKGLTAVTYPNNVLADVVGTAAQLEQALSVNLVVAERADVLIFYEPDRQPSSESRRPCSVSRASTTTRC